MQMEVDATFCSNGIQRGELFFAAGTWANPLIGWSWRSCTSCTECSVQMKGFSWRIREHILNVQIDKCSPDGFYKWFAYYGV